MFHWKSVLKTDTEAKSKCKLETGSLILIYTIRLKSYFGKCKMKDDILCRHWHSVGGSNLAGWRSDAEVIGQNFHKEVTIIILIYSLI